MGFLRTFINTLVILVVCLNYVRLLTMTHEELEIVHQKWEKSGRPKIFFPDLKMDLKQHPDYCFFPSLTARVIAFLTLNCKPDDKVLLKDIIPEELFIQILVLEKAMELFVRPQNIYYFIDKPLLSLLSKKSNAYALQAFLGWLEDRTMQESMVTQLLFYAAYIDSEQILNYLESLGANLRCNESGCSLLEIASQRNNIAAVRFLVIAKSGLASQSQINRAKARQGNSRFALSKYYAEAKNLLSNAIACPILEKKNSQFLAAARSGDVEVLKKLLFEGAEIDAIDEQNNTPLMCAAQNGQIEAVKFLIANNAVRWIMNIDWLTAEMLACNAGHIEIMQMLGLLRYSGNN